MSNVVCFSCISYLTAGFVCFFVLVDVVDVVVFGHDIVPSDWGNFFLLPICLSVVLVVVAVAVTVTYW